MINRTEDVGNKNQSKFLNVSLLALHIYEFLFSDNNNKNYYKCFYYVKSSLYFIKFSLRIQSSHNTILLSIQKVNFNSKMMLKKEI